MERAFASWPGRPGVSRLHRLKMCEYLRTQACELFLGLGPGANSQTNQGNCFLNDRVGFAAGGGRHQRLGGRHFLVPSEGEEPELLPDEGLDQLLRPLRGHPVGGRQEQREDAKVHFERVAESSLEPRCHRIRLEVEVQA